MKNLIKTIRNNQLGISLLILNAVLLIIYTPAHYYFEMFQSLAFQFMLIIIALFLFFLLTKNLVSALSSGLAIFLLIFHLPLYTNTNNMESNMTIAHFNVYKYNNSYEKTVNAALDSDADFLSFNEVTPEWEEKLTEELSDSYPYYHIQQSENNSFGIAVFSKSPISDLKVHYWGSDIVPSLSGSTSFQNKEIHFVAAHTIPPTNKSNFSFRNNHLHAIKAYLKTIEGSKFLVGDLNAVSWSEPLLEIQDELKLLDSRKNWQPTYPSWFSLGAIPIDHIFHSQDIYCTNFYTLKSTDSDHYGIVGEFYINELYGAID